MQIERLGGTHGWYWLRDGFALYKSCWGKMFGLIFLLVLSAGLLTYIPVLGLLLQIFPATFVIAAQIRLADRVARGAPHWPGLLDFPAPVRRRLVKVAGFCCAAVAGIHLLLGGAMALMAGGVTEMAEWLADPGFMLPPVSLSQLKLLLAGAMVLHLLYLAISWALIPLALWTERPLRAAVAASWVAGWRNWRPMICCTLLMFLMTAGLLIGQALMLMFGAGTLEGGGAVLALLVQLLIFLSGVALLLFLCSGTVLYRMAESIFPDLQAGQDNLDPRPARTG